MERRAASHTEEEEMNQRRKHSSLDQLTQSGNEEAGECGDDVAG